MTDNKDTGGDAPRPEPIGADETDGTAEAEERTPRRVIGTPSPAESRRLLATDDGGEGIVAPQPGDELDEDAARKAERVVATLFIITFLASVGFIAVYVLSGRNGGMHGVRRAMWS